MIVKILSIDFIILLSNTNAHGDSTGSANELLPHCRNVANQTRIDNSDNTFLRGICLGIVIGARHSMDNGSMYCTPSNVTNRQMLKVAVKYMDDNPGILHEPFIHLAMMSFVKTWPCGR